MEKILIIEDDLPIRESIAEYLEDEGYKCILAKDGEEGILFANLEIPNLILCDIKMPRINGHQVLQALRENPQTSNIPFIFLSALVDKKHFREGMLLGADDYITKPFRPEELLAAVKVRLDKYNSVKKRMDILKESISYSLPHELKTPLVSILGYAEILIDKFKNGNDTEALEFSRAIFDSGVRLNRLIHQFLVYEKLSLISDNPEALEDRNVVIVTPDIIKGIADSTAGKYNRADDLVMNLNEGSVRVPLSYVSALIEELVDNALKFSNVGSKVLIESETTDNGFLLTFFDEGRGMTEEQIINIGAYQQFERNKYEQPGVGLGLAIIKKIVELYNGNIQIISEVGKGTKVKVNLP
ncbi:phosphate regulon transcriptional regulatory protein PhoB [bacterium BMS3Abin03]|nr:phosphate regulon transcriptional regulatory protein PhoB [bacterium BMS3Abin03]HDZ58766.1 hybrid sensor histidine kinase/response regulator [Ignavibacteriales bacterium]